MVVRSLLAMLAVALLGIAVPASAADLPPQVARMIVQSQRATSFHVDIATDRGTASVDYVRPGDFRMSGFGGELLHVGNAYYMKPSPATGWIAVPPDVASGLASSIPQTLQTPESFATVQNATITDAGTGVLDGKPMHKYRVVSSADAKTTALLWIGADDRLDRVDAASPAIGTATLRYSEYNAVPTIAPPL
jgi:hypothetical protein